MLMLMLSLLTGCAKPTPVEACVAYLEARCECGACDGFLDDEMRAAACVEAGEGDIDYFECQVEVLEERGAACRSDWNTQECADLQGG